MFISITCCLATSPTFVVTRHATCQHGDARLVATPYCESVTLGHVNLVKYWDLLTYPLERVDLSSFENGRV